MTVRLPVWFINIRDGCQTSPGHFDWQPLRTLCEQVRPEEPPALVLTNEAKDWHLWGRLGLFSAAAVFATTLGVPYVGELGLHPNGPYPPALFYDPNRVRLSSWGDTHDTVSVAGRNLAECSTTGERPTRFQVLLRHFVHYSGNERLREAQQIDDYGKDPVPTLIGMDANCQPTGPVSVMPRRDWSKVPMGKRHKAMMLPDGTWVNDDRAITHLVGRYNQDTGQREDSRGFHLVADLAAATGTPPAEAYRATTNTAEYGGGHMIDLLLLNEAWRTGYVTGTYKVHQHPKHRPYPTSWWFDHRLVSAMLVLP